MIQLAISFVISVIISTIWCYLIHKSKDNWSEDKDTDFP